MRLSNRFRTQCWMGLTFGLLAAIVGCSESRPPVETPAEITDKKFIGKWVENRQPEVSPFFKPSEDPDFRMVEFKEDGSFQYYICDEAGKPKGEAVVEGTWQIAAPIVSLKVSKNTLPSDKHDETPVRIIRVYTPDADGAKVPIIYVGSDNITRYYKQLK